MTTQLSQQSSEQNSTAKNGWKSAFAAFLDRRAAIMLFLGFSAGIPILLIFSSLSLWLGEAGIEKSAVTFFSWAALGYSFKFVWAPLIDELPVPVLTKKLGRRRAWLLIAQLLIICAICIMAFSDPALGQSYIYQMAVGAVLLGFSAATQDIVIDAYRIELAETEMQTVLASTYNAGYRLGMIVAGAGALFLAASLGTAKGNYIYEAWKYTYLTMAVVMVVGLITTLLIREPQVDRVDKHYKNIDYYRLVLVFVLAVASFVCFYIYSDDLIQYLQSIWKIEDSFLKFLMEAVRFLGSGAGAVFVASVLIRLGVVNQQMAYETWVNPIADFFKRYGLKLALVLLLLIGFYRISDIIAGVISNVFYQDLNFTKEQIAEAVKIYGVIFSLLGGFLGGLLAQRMNIMKLMFVGAVLASSTNLIFIGLVKSGAPMQAVQIHVADKTFQATPDEVGYWKVTIPSQDLVQTKTLRIDAALADQTVAQQYTVPYLIDNGTAQIKLFPVTSDNSLTAAESKQSIVIKGQTVGLKLTDLQEDKPITLKLDAKTYPAKLDKDGLFSGTIDGKDLQASASKTIIAVVNYKNPKTSLYTDQRYQLTEKKADIDVDIQPVPVVKADTNTSVEIKGKVIEQYSSGWLYFAIVVDNLASGLAGAAFIAFLSSLTSVSFTAVQYAIFSSLMTLTPKILGGYSGTIVTNIGYPKFFLMTTLIGIPILLLVLWVAKLLREHQLRETQD
ncbi:MFS transporter [Acinetobacter bereziniae]|uniref:AmpG family muropeptide MFS transporter n=1 Tax=Acinetobacter bereziniae TaxID=106648 RepID=UPI000EF74EAF|nr:MFS transporter [Acinetobacter bereziniae]MBJ8421275.1 MFS transporter [Acinetobacter bereziniae]MCU4434785.1 MFS transporter [Acinetobacter bereziniae]MCU4473744.1 MFS transporter [Acinetobacter bereziniae]MCU4542931.1 MFS transporter [Acinetobacter bereziniae]MCU4626811.1 MFS transporter [Acinetobacter bereziniae]